LNLHKSIKPISEEFMGTIKRIQSYGAKRLKALGIASEEQLDEMLYAEREAF
jgi:hypothetical protein